MTTAFVEGIGVWGPGITDWRTCRERLSDAADSAKYSPPPAATLSSRERRRSIATARLAVEVAGQACAAGRRGPEDYATVFASSAGDLDTLDNICQTLAAEAKLLSPTRFHNSVHNAPGGYWSIAGRCQRPSNALSAGPFTFASGLLEAAIQCRVEETPVMLIAYDLPGPEPLASICGIDAGFALALALTPEAGPGRVAISMEYKASPAAPTELNNAALDALRMGNPAARSLPLLAAIAARERDSVVLEAGDDGHLLVHQNGRIGS